MRRENRDWRTRRDARTVKTLSQIEASISALNDEDLLDLYDIFAEPAGGVLGEFAAREMHRRGLSA